MPSRTTGQHVLPRFLLKGFSFKKGRQDYIFLFRRGVERGTPINIVNAAKRRLFYGETEETGIEDALQRQEGRYAPAVRRLRASGSIEKEDLDLLIELIANLSVRTHHFRAGMADVAEKMFCAVQDVFTGEQAAEIMYRMLRDDPSLLRGAIRGAVQQIPSFPREPQLHLWLDRFAEKLLFDYLETGKTLPGVDIEATLLGVAQHVNWEEIAEKSHIRALQKDVSPQARVAVCTGLQWSAERAPEGALLLGDFGPLGISGKTGELRPLSTLGKDVSSILLPVSDDLLMVGYSGSMPSLDWSGLRQTTAKLSAEFFVASRDSDLERNLSPLVATSSGLLTEAEFLSLKEGLSAPKQETGAAAVPSDTQVEIEVTLDENPMHGDAALSELTAVAAIVQALPKRSRPPTDVRLKFLVTDDLAKATKEVGRAYGYEASVQLEGCQGPAIRTHLSSPKRDHPFALGKSVPLALENDRS